MGNPSPSSASLSMKFALFLSLSLTFSSASSSFPRSFLNPQSTLSNPKPKSTPKATVSDLLSLLGTPQQASAVNSNVARQLKSCFKFLVPFTPTKPSVSQLLPEQTTLRRRLSSRLSRRRGKNEEDKLIWWPPAPMMELARLAVDSGGDPASIQRALDPTTITVPDIEGSNQKRCQLTRTPYGRRFVNKELNEYMKFLFEIIAARGPNVGLSVSLNRYDFFHGHLFIATDGRLGILFHAKEYPAYEKEVFPYNMGFCQVGSNVTYNELMNLRNILWLAPLPSNSTKAWLAPGVLVVLDAHPEGIIYRDLIPEYVDLVRTLYEDDFGDVVVDVNYLNVGRAAPDYQIFIC